jgi:16S rRNA (cytosine967-C5)-methyltransferase
LTPLSEQLKATAKVVAFVMAGRSLNEVLADGSVVKPDLRPGVQALSFVTLRHWGMAMALRTHLAARPPMPAVDALLCTALALLVSEHGEGADYTDFTLVNQAVEAAKAYSKTRSSSAFINATLRRFLRERETLLALASQEEPAYFDHPQWWIDRLRKEQPEHWQAVLACNQIQPPLSLRVNTAKTTRTAYMALLAAQGLACEAAPLPETLEATCGLGSGVVIRAALPVTQLPHFAQGWVSVQDMAAQGAARQLLSDDYLATLVARTKQGHTVRILDACAAPGGKTTHLIELLTKAFQDAGLPVNKSDGVEFKDMPFQVLALEVDRHRAQRIHENVARLGQRVSVKVADAASVNDWWSGEPFDAILLDAPCTASGIVRRHPDVRWLRRSTDVDVLAAVQLRLLKILWHTLAQGGRLLYATCSVFKAEGDDVVSRFMEQQPSAKWLDSKGLWLPSVDNDGFYDALFEKIPLPIAV